jgi:adenosylcobinamide-phosphate synthase
VIIYTTGFLLVSALIMDFIFGDPRRLPHPTAGIGWCISRMIKRWNHGSAAERKRRGIWMTVCITGGVWAAGALIISLLTLIHPLLGLGGSVWMTYSAVAGKGLKEAAEAVKKPLEADNLQEAEKALSMIVGRDTAGLSESEIVRGTVETVAENTVDGVTSPIFWALIGGGPAAMAYRAVNTLDSMAGYKNDSFSSFGWASARLDDAANWLPARLTSAAIWLAAFAVPGSRKRAALIVLLRDARKHPSPNSGWSEALVAGLLGVTLGGTNYYNGIRSQRALMGDGKRQLHAQDITRSICYLYGGAVVFTIFCVAAWWLFGGWGVPFVDKS